MACLVGRRRGLALTALAFAAAGSAVRGQVVISQVFGGGGNSGAVWRNDFVEIVNVSNEPVDITGWSIQYASNAGNIGGAPGLITPLAGRHGAHGGGGWVFCVR